MAIDNGILQAFLDQELNPDESKKVRDHLDSCAQCRIKLEELQQCSGFVNNVLSNYQSAHQKMPVNSKLAWERFTLNHSEALLNQSEGWMIMMIKKYRKTAVAAGLVIGIGLSLFLQPVRTVAAQFLSVFRVQQMQTISISPAELNQMSELFKKNQGSLNIKNFGEFSVTGNREPQVLTRTEALQKIPGAVLPIDLPGGYTLQNMVFNTARQVNLKLKLQNINSLLQNLGATKLLPSELDGKTFEIRIPEILGARYSYHQNHLTLLETRSPELITPDGISPVIIREALLQLPFLPPELAGQLRAVNDWQHTLVVPSTNGNTEAITIGGYSGIYFSTAKNAAIMAKFFPEVQSKMEKVKIPENAGFILWQVHDTVYMLSGNMDKNTLIALAGSIR